MRHGDGFGEPDGGISRRDVLRKSALVGGAMVWAVPAVQTLGAPAFAASTTVGEEPPPGNGIPSYVFVFFKRTSNGGTNYYSVKYDQQGNGACGAGRANVSSDSNGVGFTYFDNLMVELFGSAANPPFQTGCPPHVTSEKDPVSGDLEVTLGDNSCKIIGWLLHDGSCKDNRAGVDGFRYAANAGAPGIEFDPQNIGPTVPSPNQGMFYFSKCK
ncbi:MAG: twin-arginine translocation signal domain-containing protein [Actinomycetes bacterium]